MPDTTKPVVAPPPKRKVSRGRVLLADDEDAIRRVMGRVLRNLGFEVLEAKTGKEGVELMERRPEKLELVLTDVVMPDMGGPEMVAHLRQRDPDLRVLYVSGHTFDQLNIAALHAHERFLAKPFTGEELRKTLEELLGPAGLLEAPDQRH